jgi:glutamate/tyrosine decarboxylase-like PLP-dependent enzyme
MSITPEDQRQLFDRIKHEFFVDPDPNPEDYLTSYIGKIQAHLSVLIGNMLEWFVVGSTYTPLKEALQEQLDNLKQRTTELAKVHLGSSKRQTDNSPFVIAPGWGLNKIRLPFAPSSGFEGLTEALPIIDTDTGGAIRFNHHYIGELHPQGNIIALAASIAASFLNENAVIPKVSPSLTTWEKQVVNWIWHMLENKQPGECGCAYSRSFGSGDACTFKTGSGRIVAGGTIANLTALFIGREKFRTWCHQNGQNPAEVKPVVLYSSHSHYSIRKAARVVGFIYDKDDKRSEIVRVEGKNYWYITADDVARAIQAANARGQYVVMVSVLAGATDTGFVDDLNGIANVISEYNESPLRASPPIYYHIDAAMGGPFRLLSSLKWQDQAADFSADNPSQESSTPEPAGQPLLFEGIHRGDAITIDGHKYFYCNYPCGGIFVRKESDFNCLHEDARYLESGESEEEEPEELGRLYQNFGLEKSPLQDLELEWRDRRGLRTLEGSRGIIGITQLYFTLKVFGPEGIKALLQHTLDMTVELRRLIKTTRNDKTLPALELITCGPLNQTLFRVVTNWDTRTEPEQIELDNDVNFLIPYYANWVQTGALQAELQQKKDTKKSNGEGKLAGIITDILKGQHSIPFYVGTDQLLDHLPDDEHDRPKLVGAFLDYVWRINGEGSCPIEDKQNVQKWLRSLKDPKHPKSKRRSLQVLKAVVTHPYTNNDVMKKFVDDICKGAQAIRQVLEIKKQSA